MEKLHRFCPWDGCAYVDGAPKCTLCQCPRGAGHPEKKHKPPWRKVLYEQQPYEDNFTDETFLASLVMNANVVKKDYWTVVRGSIVVSQQICTVVTVAAMAAYVLQGKLGAMPLLLIDGILLAAVIGCLLLTETQQALLSRQAIMRNALKCALLVGGVYVLTPVLQTLTRSISSDTIWTSTVYLLLVHLLFHDYTYSHAVTSKFSGNISLMASIFASVLLSSRVDSQTTVFGLILFSLELFVLSPAVWHRLRKRSKRLAYRLSLASIVPSTLFLVPLSSSLAALLSVVVAFTSFLCPLWLIWIQKYKYSIHGPWDEARLVFASAG